MAAGHELGFETLLFLLPYKNTTIKVVFSQLSRINSPPLQHKR
jgi:hypothetical protein